MLESVKNREELYKIMKEIVEKYKDKKLLYKKMNRAILTFESCYSVDQDAYKELANLTKEINFGCDIKGNKCKAGRTNMCCCANCCSFFGHLNRKFFTRWDDEEYIEKEILYYAKKYSIKTGFWRKNKGCILPRHKRSATCLTYNCNYPNLTSKEVLLLDIIRWNRLPPYINRLIKILKDHFLCEAK